jgi:hypothetical protein
MAAYAFVEFANVVTKTNKRNKIKPGVINNVVVTTALLERALTVDRRSNYD